MVVQFRVIRSKETPVNETARTKFATTMRANTVATALAVRGLFLQLKTDNVRMTTKELINETVKHSGDTTPVGTALYQAYAGGTRTEVKPLSRAVVIAYLHGYAGAGDTRETIGDDLVGDLRPKPALRQFGTMHHETRDAISLTPILDRLDAIDSHLQALAEGRTEYQAAIMEKLTQLISIWSSD